MSLAALTLDDAGKRLRKREFSSLELTEAVFQRIAASDDKIHAYLTVARDDGLEQARQADKRLKQDSGISPLLGQFSYLRPAHHLRIENSWRVHSTLRRGNRPEASRRRRGHYGKNQSR
jgi:Amidase